MTAVRPTGRWRGVVALSLFAGAVGLLSARSGALLLATIGIGFAVYPRLVSSPPEPELAVERTISPESPADTDRVDVSVTVRNEGEQWIPDLRVVDGVPSLLPVVDGTPRRATALAPGDETTIQYAVEARAGKHRFESTTVLCRDPSGAFERRTTVSEPTVVDCGAPVSSAALRDLTRRRPGEILTDDGGSGIEFHCTREYRRGDPMNRIDWRRFARTGELATIEFREERAGAIVLCVDVGPDPANEATRGSWTPHAVARSVLSADRIAEALVDADHEVGLATLGPKSCWLSPGVGRGHLARIRHRLDTSPAFVAAPVGGAGDANAANGARAAEDAAEADTSIQWPGLNDVLGHDDPAESGGSTPALSDGGELPTRQGGGDGGGPRSNGRRRQTTELRERLGQNVQVTLLSPLADDGVVDAATTLEMAGYPVVVVSPDATARESVGSRLAAVERSTRIRTLRRTGIPVVDWKPNDDLGNAILATQEQIE